MSIATMLMTPLLALVLLLVGLEISRMVRGWVHSRTSLRSAYEERVRIGLEDDKERLLLALRDLEFEYEMDKVSDQDYAAMRSRLSAEAIDVIGALKGMG